MKVLSLLTLLFLASCLKDNLSPEAALKDFVESRIGQVIEREFVIERTTGKMLQSFENMPEDDFQKFADMRNIKSESFKVLSKSCQEKKCFLTYSIAYLTKENDKPTFTSEVKKIAELVEVDNKWLIADVSNIKTYHESLEPINPLE
jgi:hypothetical protein